MTLTVWEHAARQFEPPPPPRWATPATMLELAALQRDQDDN